MAQELIARVARVPGDAKKIAEADSVTLRIASTQALSFTFLPRWLRSLESHTTLGPVQLMSDVLERCEALMLQSKVQFVLSHAHGKAQGALDAEPYHSARIGEDVLIAVSAPDRGGGARHQLRVRGAAVPVLQHTEQSGLGRIVAVGSDAWHVPLEIRLYRDSELPGKAANAFWKALCRGC